MCCAHPPRTPVTAHYTPCSVGPPPCRPPAVCVCGGWSAGTLEGEGEGEDVATHTQGRWPPGALPSALVECLHGKGRGVGVPPGPIAGQLPVTKVDLMGLLLGVKVVTDLSAAYAPTPSCTVPHTHQAQTYLLCRLPPTPSRPARVPFTP